MNPKLDNALHALVLIDKAAVSSVALAAMMGCSRLTAVRLVNSLRDLGCTITSERDGHEYWYTLTDWGVFAPERVRRYVLEQQRSGAQVDCAAVAIKSIANSSGSKS